MSDLSSHKIGDIATGNPLDRGVFMLDMPHRGAGETDRAMASRILDHLRALATARPGGDTGRLDRIVLQKLGWVIRTGIVAPLLVGPAGAALNDMTPVQSCLQGVEVALSHVISASEGAAPPKDALQPTGHFHVRLNLEMAAFRDDPGGTVADVLARIGILAARSVWRGSITGDQNETLARFWTEAD